jgi:hypothetical protein
MTGNSKLPKYWREAVLVIGVAVVIWMDIWLNKGGLGISALFSK